MQLILQPISEDTVGSYLNRIFNNEFGAFSHFHAAIAFAKSSGVRHIIDNLKSFSEAGGTVKLIIGIDHYGTSVEALNLLLELASDQFQVVINHAEGDYVTFHPKIYLFENETSAIVIIGSNNLTQGGLFTNDEASLVSHLDLSKADDENLLLQLKAGLTKWSDEETNNARLLTPDFLKQLSDQGYIFTEEILRLEARTVEEDLDTKTDSAPEEATDTVVIRERLFGKPSIKRSAPKILHTRSESAISSVAVTATPTTIPVTGTGFVMTLQQTDVGSGQKTPGANRRSPEIFIPLIARNANPEFWGWPDLFTADVKIDNKMNRPGVPFRIGTGIVLVNMMTWPAKADFRLRSEVLRSAGNIGDILRIERNEQDDQYEYYAVVVPPGTSDYDKYLALCNNKTRNSAKLWGYYTI